MAPVAVSKARPAGRPGVMAQLVAGPPVLVGTRLGKRAPRVRLKTEGM